MKISCQTFDYFSLHGMILMQTFDAVDGKQARRTNSSSPLGELFDHGNFHLKLKLMDSVLGKLPYGADKFVTGAGCDALACAVRPPASLLSSPMILKLLWTDYFILSISLSLWRLEARQCVERLPSGFGSFQLSHFTLQPGSSEFLCSFPVVIGLHPTIYILA